VTQTSNGRQGVAPQDGELLVLILEDEPVDAELTARALEPAGIKAQVKVVDTRKSSFAEQLTQSPARRHSLAELHLAGFDGGAGHWRSPERTAPEVPFIFVTGTLGRSMRSIC